MNQEQRIKDAVHNRVWNWLFKGTDGAVRLLVEDMRQSRDTQVFLNRTEDCLRMIRASYDYGVPMTDKGCQQLEKLIVDLDKARVVAEGLKLSIDEWWISGWKAAMVRLRDEITAAKP